MREPPEARLKRVRDPIIRFNEKYRVTEGGCWVWKADCGEYGGFLMNGKQEKAHRASWRLFRGEIPIGKKHSMLGSRRYQR